MGKKLERIFRTQKLTSEEVAKDEEIRRKVQEEFPPARPAHSSIPGSFSETLKKAIRTSGKSVAQLSGEAGVSQLVISQFLAGERDIRMATADKLAEVLGLKLGIGS